MPTDNARAVRIARASAGLTLAQLEARTLIDRSNLSAMESGRRVPNEAQIEAIAKACGLTRGKLGTLATTSLADIVSAWSEWP